MILTRRVALNSVWLDEIDDRIVISAVEPGEGKENISTSDTATGFGQRITGQKRTTLDIVVRFRMLEHGKNVEGLQERAELLEAVNTWAANGGELTVNYKPNRRINVVLAQAPGEGSLWDYTKEYTLTFRAYAVPYWEDLEPQTMSTGTANEGSGTIVIGGSAKTQVDVLLENKSGKSIAEATVAIAGRSMTFSGLDMAGGESLVIDHKDGLLRARIKNGSTYRSVMAKRTTGSANDFLLTPGTRACSFTASRACKMTVTWRARYL